MSGKGVWLVVDHRGRLELGRQFAAREYWVDTPEPGVVLLTAVTPPDALEIELVSVRAVRTTSDNRGRVDLGRSFAGAQFDAVWHADTVTLTPAGPALRRAGFFDLAAVARLPKANSDRILSWRRLPRANR